MKLMWVVRKLCNGVDIDAENNAAFHSFDKAVQHYIECRISNGTYSMPSESMSAEELLNDALDSEEDPDVQFIEVHVLD